MSVDSRARSFVVPVAAFVLGVVGGLWWFLPVSGSAEVGDEGAESRRASGVRQVVAEAAAPGGEAAGPVRQAVPLLEAYPDAAEWLEVPVALVLETDPGAMMITRLGKTEAEFLEQARTAGYQALRLAPETKGALSGALHEALQTWAGVVARGAVRLPPEEGQTEGQVKWLLTVDPATMKQLAADLETRLQQVLPAERAHLYRALAHQDLAFLYGNASYRVAVTEDGVEISPAAQGTSLGMQRRSIAPSSPLGRILSQLPEQGTGSVP
ncbi:hypothetical protein [Verrucomicrobium sp. BvORR034]|uniref:hypothetical protein n=1 Tax=Verrucomicrobium sp. BvORR034 TaxID=1396418 RepID=UPI0006786D19|nr:hypothetical protein [Verrucomicrobium sp. BvORR034]